MAESLATSVIFIVSASTLAGSAPTSMPCGNFGPQDLSIIQYWLGGLEPVSVSRQGMDFIQNGIDDVVFLNLEYPSKVIANVHVSWLDPQKVRKIVVVGSRRMVVYDDLAESKIAIYDKGIDRKAILGENMDFDNPRPLQFNYRSRDILLPQIQFKEPLRVEVEHFRDCDPRERTAAHRYLACPQRRLDSRAGAALPRQWR